MRNAVKGPTKEGGSIGDSIIRAVLILSMAAVVCLVDGACGYAASKDGTVTVGIVTDGENRGALNIPEHFLNELGVLTEHEFKIEAPDSKRIDGGWSIDKIKKAIADLENDPQVDIILALGPAASHVAVLQKDPPKPTFAPFVINDRLLGFDRKDDKSGLKNVNYLTSGEDFREELKIFRSVVPFTRVVVLMENTLFQSIPEHSKAQAVLVAKGEGIEAALVPVGADPSEFLSKIPSGIQSVILTPMLQLDEESTKKVINGIREKKLPSFGMGQVEVEQGILMSLRPASEIQRIARRLALNIQAVLRGEAAADQPVLFERKRQLRINMGTARALGISPRFEILSEAVLINEDEEGTGSPLTLEGAAKESIQKNLTVIAGRLGVKADAEQVNIVRSALFPQVQSGLNFTMNRDDYPTAQTGSTPRGQTDGNITVKQIVFSESALAKLGVQQHLHVASQAQQKTLELDVVQNVTTAFLDVLIAETKLNIQKDNLSLARANLEIAKVRVQTGTVDVSDVYRWESEIATARQNVLAAKASREQKRDALNLVLQRPISERFLLYPATLSDPNSMINRKELPAIVNNPRAFNLMGEFVVDEGVKLSPELEQLKAQLDANERQFLSDRLAFVVPDISVASSLESVFDEKRASGAFPALKDKTNWQTGFEFTYPLFEGGQRLAKVSQSAILVEQLKAQHAQMREQVEETIRQHLHAIRASYPSIELSAQGAEAARKNFELVRDNYAQGKRSIVDLLDAQNASLSADQTAANAVYNYFMDLMKLQRSIGEFYFFWSDPRRDETIDRMKAYIANGGKA